VSALLAKDDQYFIELAEMIAMRSPDIKRRVGAVIVKDGHKISEGFNKPLKKIEDYFCQSKQPYMVHAEMDALLKITSKQSKDACIYITLAPCMDCCKIIAASGITKVVYKDEHKESNINYLKELGIQVYKYDDILDNCDKIESLQE
jgi:dCMP deaminase